MPNPTMAGAHLRMSALTRATTERSRPFRKVRSNRFDPRLATELGPAALAERMGPTLAKRDVQDRDKE